MTNFTIQDIARTSLAVVLFSLIYVSPGYLAGWLFDLFDFRSRSSATRLVIAIVLSMAISPILTFLTWHLLSVAATFVTFGAIALAALIIFFRTKGPLVTGEIKRLQLIAVCMGLGWILLSILSLVDIQWGDRLYYNVISFDFTTRAAIINAMTRSGVPPINPGYFPGHSVQLTYLYYFWYIPCSLVAQLGSPWVDGRIAMIGSVAWCGLGVMATIALYLRLRNPDGGTKAWRSALIGNGLLLISGVDIIPALFMMISTRLINGASNLQGDIEQWNEQITAWIGAISWVPHHVAAAIACLTGMMLLLSVRDKPPAKRLQAMSIAGLAFASAFGLSVYVTLVFVVFWGVWMIVLFLQKERQLAMVMTLAGIIAAVAISPFIAGLLSGGSGTSGGFPIALGVRSFYPVIPFLPSMPPILLNLIFLVLLPFNYLMELGFFLAAGLLWVQQHNQGLWKRNPFHVAEIILLSAVFFAGSFTRSTAIGNNDLGWRAWLLGQFVLLIWSVDILPKYFFNDRQDTGALAEIKKTGRQLSIFIMLGLATTILDIALLRTWPMLVDANIAGFPNSLSLDTKLGERTFAARQAYGYINSALPKQIRVQHDPADLINRPVGLYLDRPMAIAGQTAYGIPPQEFEDLVNVTAKIFLSDSSWSEIDQACIDLYIDVIVVNDLDPLWKHLPELERSRNPLYRNKYYAAFACGTFIGYNSQP